ncbi:MAG: DUF2442 domain-containing protein [Bryobacter sp.]|nr:DUF2442 domain-containing protein [Bryobacter sp.]
MALVRILEVEPLAGFVVRLKLTNGEEVERNLGPLLHGPIFEALRLDESRLRQVRAMDGTLVWPGGVDLCPDTVIWGGLPPSDAAASAA